MRVISMRRRYYQSRGKGWFGESERHRASALRKKTGNKREQASQAQMRIMEMQQEAPVMRAPVVSTTEESMMPEETPVIAQEESGSILGQDDREVGAVGQGVSSTTSTNGLFRPSPLLFARKKRAFR